MEETSSVYISKRFCLVYKKLQMGKYVNYNQEEKKYFRFK